MKAWRNVALRFGLVSVPVSIAPAKSDKPSVSAHHFDAATRERARQAWTSDGETLAAETVMLYDVEGDAVEIDAPRVGNDGEVLSGADPAPPMEITLEAWTESAGIDPLLYDAAYCLFPGKGGAEGLGLVARVLRDNPTRVLAGRARFTDRPRSVVIRWSEAAGAVILHTLAFTSRVRFEGMREVSRGLVEPSAELLAQGALLTESLPSTFTPADSDPMETAVVNALRAAVPKGKRDAIPTVPTTAADILATLRADIAKQGAKQGAKGSAQGADTPTPKAKGGRRAKETAKN